MKKTLALVLLTSICFAAPFVGAKEPPPRPVKPKVFRGLEVVSVYPHYVGVMREGKFEKVYSPVMTAEERQAFGVLEPDRAKEYGETWDRVMKQEEDNVKAMAIREKEQVPADRPAQGEASAPGTQVQSGTPVGEAPTPIPASAAVEGRRETVQEYNDRLYREKQQSAAERAAREKQYQTDQEKKRISAEEQAAEARRAADRAAFLQREQRENAALARKMAREQEREAQKEAAREAARERARLLTQ